jgi:hypothetical protein
MMKRIGIQIFCAFLSALIFSPAVAVADSNEKTIAVFKKSSAVQPYFANAYGYAVYPTVIKGGHYCWRSFRPGKGL